jgi:uncharacterized phage-associated protein
LKNEKNNNDEKRGVMMPQIPDITDVANWFLNKEATPHKKLQKLCYYAVAWSYALAHRPLCQRDEFQAWVHGPVNLILYEKYKAFGYVPIPQTNPWDVFDNLSSDVLDFVWVTYKHLTPDQLENLTHAEPPWQIARNGLEYHERSEKIIDPEDMKIYYAQLYEEAQND